MKHGAICGGETAVLLVVSGRSALGSQTNPSGLVNVKISTVRRLGAQRRINERRRSTYKNTPEDFVFVISTAGISKSAQCTVAAKKLCRLHASSSIQIFGVEIKEIYRTNYSITLIIF